MQSTGTELPKQPRITAKGKIDRRGRKKCPSCSVTVGARKIVCECGHVFKPKTKRKDQITEWWNLPIGAKIKISGGSFYMGEDENGNVIPKPFGYTGRATVAEICEDGLRIWENGGETAFVYMGPDYETDIGIYKRAAVLTKFKAKRNKYNAVNKN